MQTNPVFHRGNGISELTLFHRRVKDAFETSGSSPTRFRNILSTAPEYLPRGPNTPSVSSPRTSWRITNPNLFSSSSNHSAPRRADLFCAVHEGREK